MKRESPRFYGVRTYNDPLGRFHFRHPTTWQQYDLDGGRQGVMFAPDSGDPHTYFSAWVTELQHPVVDEDLEVLKAGVAEGQLQLPGCKVEHESDSCIGNLVKMERVLTFSQGGQRHKRRTCILFADRWRIVLTWQGASDQEYEHWFAMANYSFASFSVAQELWFSTDMETGAREA